MPCGGKREYLFAAAAALPVQDDYLCRMPRATMQINQIMPVKIVRRSRFRSTTEDDPSEEVTPPPNRSERPPPLPLCSSTSTSIRMLVMIRTIEIPTVTAAL